MSSSFTVTRNPRSARPPRRTVPETFTPVGTARTGNAQVCVAETSPPCRCTRPSGQPIPAAPRQRLAPLIPARQGLAVGGAKFNSLGGCWYGEGSIYLNVRGGRRPDLADPARWPGSPALCQRRSAAALVQAWAPRRSASHGLPSGRRVRQVPVVELLDDDSGMDACGQHIDALGDLRAHQAHQLSTQRRSGVQSPLSGSGSDWYPGNRPCDRRRRSPR